MSTVQSGSGGVIARGMFSWHILGPLIQTEHPLNATAYLNMCVRSFHLWQQSTHLLMTTSGRTLGHVTKHTTGSKNMKMSSVHSNRLHSHPILAPLGCGGVHSIDVQTTNLQQLCDDIMSTWIRIPTKRLQQLVETMTRIIPAVLRAKRGYI